MIHTPPSDRKTVEKTAMAREVDITDLQQRLQNQERLIRQLQEQQQPTGPSQGTDPSGTSVNDLNFTNFVRLSIKDALEAVPTFDGDNASFSHFVEGCEEALSMIAPSQEIILVRAIRNKLKGDAHRSILGKVFNTLQSLVEFLRNRYGSRESVYEAQARLAYICQKDGEKVSTYANRVREIGKRILDAQKRQSNEVSQEFHKSMEEHLKICFLRGLDPEIKILKDGTFDEVETRAIDAERELETIKMIREVVLGNKASIDNKRVANASLRRVNAEPVKCQFCHKNGHTADRCRLIGKPPVHQNLSNNTNSSQSNFSRNDQYTNHNNRGQGNYNNYNNYSYNSNRGNNNQNNNINTYTRELPPPPGRSPQNHGNQIICRYCKKEGHVLADCRKRAYNNQIRNNQGQGNEPIPAKTGATPGNTNTRPTRAIASESITDIEQ